MFWNGPHRGGLELMNFLFAVSLLAVVLAMVHVFSGKLRFLEGTAWKERPQKLVLVGCRILGYSVLTTDSYAREGYPWRKK